MGTEIKSIRLGKANITSFVNCLAQNFCNQYIYWEYTLETNLITKPEVNVNFAKQKELKSLAKVYKPRINHYSFKVVH
jgi:tmRNA-binding protein